MKGSFNKVYSHPIVVEEQQLRNLATIIIDRFVFGIKKLVEYIYPKGGIVIGEQKELMIKRKWWRNLLCISVILTTIIGVVSGRIVEEIRN